MATDHKPDEARYEALLIDYHDAIARGVDEAAFWEAAGDLPHELRERLELAGACVRQLHVAWHSPRDSTQSVRDELTPSPILNPATIEAPNQIGRFRIERELGRGGNGVVLLGIDPRLGRRVAIKIPLPDVLAHADLRGRFLREAEIAARLTHPNLLAVHESGESGPICYIASEYCAGPNLAEWLREQRSSQPPSITTIVNLMIPLAEAVQHAHARGVLHRDLKPSNVLLEPVEGSPAWEANRNPRGLPLSDYVPKVGDFGLAKLVELDADHTRTGMVLGTVLYMSPEQAEGRVRDISVQSDVYGLGAILYELLTGRPPHRGDNERATLHQILLCDPDRPSQVKQGIPRDLEAICLKCLEKQPTARYATADALADDLRKHQAGLPTQARPPRPIEHLQRWVRRRPLVTALSMLLLLAFATMLVGTIVYNGRLRVSERASREYAYGADMMLAQLAWDRSAPIEAKELLDRHIPKAGEDDLRRFEWYGLRKRFEEDSTVVAHQPSAVWALAASPDDELLATGDPLGVIRLWNRQSRAMVRELRGHDAMHIDRLLFTPDGQHLVSAGDDHTIRWWNLASGENTLVWREHADWIGGLAQSPNGAWIASGGGDGRVLLWNAESKSLERELYQHPEAVRWIVFSPTEPWLVSASEDGSVRIWDYLENRPPEHLGDGLLPLHETKMFHWRDAGFRADGSHLYAGSRDWIYQWDVRPQIAADRVLNVFPSSNDKAMSIALMPKRNLLIEAGDKTPSLVTHACNSSFAAEHSLAGHSDSVRCLVTLSDGETVLSGSEDGDVRQWDRIGVDLDGAVAELPGRPKHIAWSPDSDRLWVLTFEHDIIEIDDFESPRLVTRHELFGDCRRLYAFRNKHQLLGIDFEGTVYLWNGEPRRRESFKVFDACPDLTELDSTGDKLAYANSTTVGLINATNGQLFWTHDLKTAAYALLFMPDGTLAVGCENGSICSLAMDDGRELKHGAPHRYGIWQMAVSSDGQRIAIATKGNMARILDAGSLQELQTFARPDSTSRVWFLDDDERLLVGNESATTVIHARTGQDLMTFSGVRSTSEISPDGRWISTLHENSVRWRRLRED